MTMANRSPARSSHQQDDDVHDQIGSSSSTPSGIATPQLDPTDKRLPGIMHSFFAQVGACSDSTSASASFSSRPNNKQRPPAPPTAPDTCSHCEGEAEVPSDNCSLSGSIVFLERDQVSDNVPSAQSEQKCDPLDNERRSLEPAADPSSSLPTPPPSSSCSMLHSEAEEAENGGPVVAQKGVGSVYRALKNLVLSKNPSKTKCHTSYPVSSVSNDAVLASHFSKPPSLAPPLTHTQTQTVSACPEPSSQPTTSKSSEEPAKLTDSTVVAAPHSKSTPPLTPRAMSNETQQAEKRSDHSPAAASPARPPPPPQPEPSRTNGDDQQSADRSASTRTSTVSDDQGLPVIPLKGKLTVKISEGRGLRPSYDPYVVCVFEWNEAISGTAHADSPSPDSRAKKSVLDGVGSEPIQRSNSDSGRPMAIPMKSRQSSQNSMQEGNAQEKAAEVTHPQWNHDAVLCVSCVSLALLRAVFF